MNSREAILQRIRSSAGRPAPTRAEAQAAYGESVSRQAPRPRWDGDRRERFLERLEAAAATWAPLDEVGAIPGAVGNYLADQGLPRTIHLAPHPALDELEWPDDWQVRRGTEDLAEARVTLTVARFGIAETGTLMLPGGPSAPPSMNLLAEHHLVLLRAENLLDYQEEAWAGYRAEAGALPRAMMMVTGPSRTADIEQTLQLGAHGPRHLHLLLLGEGG